MATAPSAAPPAAPPTASSPVMDGLAEYGRIRSTIGKWFSYVIGVLVIIGGIWIIVMGSTGKLHSTCVYNWCCNPEADAGCTCDAWKADDHGCGSRPTKHCKQCDSLSKGTYVGIGIGMIGVAIIVMVIGTIMARLTHESKGFAAVTGGVGAVSDVMNVTRLATGGGANGLINIL